MSDLWCNKITITFDSECPGSADFFASELAMFLGQKYPENKSMDTDVVNKKMTLKSEEDFTGEVVVKNIMITETNNDVNIKIIKAVKVGEE